MPSRVRQSTAAPASTRTELPAYEPPTFSLTPASQRLLAQLAETHNLAKLNDNLSQAAAALTNAAGDINERLTEKERAVKKRRNAAQASPTSGGTNGVKEAEQSLDEMKDKVERMTQRMDEGVRKLIDGQHGVNYMKDGLAKMAETTRNTASTQASTQQRGASQRRRRTGINEDGEEEEDDDEYQDFEPTDPAGQPQASQTTPIDLFRSNMETSKTRYQSHSLRERYANNNDYRGFKQMVHHSRHPEEDIPMPHQNGWFAEDGPAPAPGVTTRTRAGAEDEDDDDIAVSRAMISTKCPLTLQEFRNPLSSKKCPHTFESSAILEMVDRNRVGGRPGPRGTMIGGVPGVQCPVQGCSQQLTRDDLHVDAVLVRKIQRLQRARQLAEDEAEYEEDDGTSRGTQRRAHLIDDDEEDGTNIDDLLDDKGYVPATQLKVERHKNSQRAPPRSSARTDVVELGSEDEEAEEEDEDTQMD